MIIGRSLSDYVFIRTCIIALRLVTPTSFGVLALWFTHWLAIHPVLLAWCSLEVAFYLLVYLPRKRYLQKDAEHPPLATREEREALFKRCHDCIPDAEQYFIGWFPRAQVQNIKRQNVEEWMLWAVFSMDPRKVNDDEWAQELDGYVQQIQRILGREFEEGRGEGVDAMRLTVHPVSMIHRPLIWYTIVGLVDFVTHVSLTLRGFRHHAASMGFGIFPPRPLTLFSRSSASPQLSYWYRPHLSTSKKPIVFLHGIGIGLYPYIEFFSDIITAEPEVGILAIEILPISMRVTSPPLSRPIFCNQVDTLLREHGFDEFVLVGHSYGTILSTHILHDPVLRSRVSGLLLVDPIPFLLHLPPVAYNFVYRMPRTANEWQLWYFASRDMGIAHTLGRHFFWAENILWKEELEGIPTGVVLAANDSIVDAPEVWRYLTGTDLRMEDGEWDGEQLTVLWYERIDHSQVFVAKEHRAPLIKLLGKLIS